MTWFQVHLSLKSFVAAAGRRQDFGSPGHHATCEEARPHPGSIAFARGATCNERRSYAKALQVAIQWVQGSFLGRSLVDRGHPWWSQVDLTWFEMIQIHWDEVSGFRKVFQNTMWLMDSHQCVISSSTCALKWEACTIFGMPCVFGDAFIHPWHVNNSENQGQAPNQKLLL